MLSKGSTGVITFDTTTVHNGAVTTAAFQDLDLSSVVGSNHALVILAIKPSSSNYIKIIPKDSGYSYDSNEEGKHCCFTYNTTNDTGILITHTNSSGVCEMRCLAGTPNTIQIDMIAYWVV